MLKVLTPAEETPEVLDPTKTFARLDAEAGEEEEVQDLVRDASRLAERIAARPLWFAEYEALIGGAGRTKLFLPVRPISSVSLVQFSDEDALVEGTEPSEFAIWPEYLYREDTWPTGIPGYVVKWRGGFWLPSMTVGTGSGGEATKPATAESVDVQGRHIRRWVWEIVKATWDWDHADSVLRSERTPGALGMAREYKDTGLQVPESAVRGLRSLGRRVA